MKAQAQLNFDDKLLEVSGISGQQVQDALHEKELYKGENSVNLYVNDRFIAKTRVYQPDAGAVGYLRRDLETFGLKKDAWAQSFKKGNSTYFRLSERIRLNFSRSDQSLRLTVPLALLENPDFIKKQTGGSGAFLNYNGYYSDFRDNNSVSDSLSANYQLGANSNNTMVRANGTFSRFTSSTQRYANNNVQSLYMDRDFDFGRIQGGRLNSPDGGFGVGYVDGLVYSTRGTATGAGSVAFAYDSDAPAVVEFYQRDQLVYTLNLSRGHNNLGAIPVTSLTSDVVVVIKRDGHVVDTQLISRARISRATAESSGLYAFAGRSDNDARAVTTGAGYTKRYSDALSPTIAVVAQKNYQGVSVSNTFTQGKLQVTAYGLVSRNEEKQLGTNISATLSYGATDLTYQSVSRGFTYVGQALYDYEADIKSTIGISQSFVAGENHAFSVNFNRNNFYTRASTDTWSVGYATRIRKASLNIGAGYAPHAPGDSNADKLSLNASVSLPFDLGNRHGYYRSQYNAYNNTRRLDNYLTARVNENYSVTAGHLQQNADRTETTENYISNDVDTPYTHGGLSFAKSASGTRSSTSTNMSLSGSVAASRKGIVFTPQPLKDTYAIVDTHLKGFVKVSSTRSAAKTNYNGKVILPDITDSQPDFVKVSPQGLADGVYFQNNKVDFISDRGAVSFFDFEPANNNSVLLHWTDKPAGVSDRAVFYDDQNNLIAHFIDRDVLLVKQDSITQLQRSGMFDASDSTLVCKLPISLEISNESIIDTTFQCARQNIHLADLSGRSTASAGASASATEHLSHSD